SIAGEIMLETLAGKIMCVDSGRNLLPGKAMQKAGNEQYLLLPAAGQSFLTPGPLYLVVIGEGVNPANSSQIGTGNSSYVISCAGAVHIYNLGTVGPADLVKPDTLEGGESKAYQFTVPAGVSIEARLENRVGNPVMVLRNGALLPSPGQAATGFSLDD